MTETRASATGCRRTGLTEDAIPEELTDLPRVLAVVVEGQAVDPANLLFAVDEVKLHLQRGARQAVRAKEPLFPQSDSGKGLSVDGERRLDVVVGSFRRAVLPRVRDQGQEYPLLPADLVPVGGVERDLDLQNPILRKEFVQGDRGGRAWREHAADRHRHEEREEKRGTRGREEHPGGFRGTRAPTIERAR